MGAGAGEGTLRGAGSDGPGPCDSADLTGLGLSAAVPPALVRIAGENSIPVRAAIFSRKTHGGGKLVNLTTVLAPPPPSPVCYFDAGTVTLRGWECQNLCWVTTTHINK